MSDIVLDTNIVGDFLAQYFDPLKANHGLRRFTPQGNLSASLVAHVNRILDNFHRYEIGQDSESPYSGGMVIVSTFCFIELCRKWEQIVKGRFTLLQLQDFLKQPPEWFNIAPMDETLLPYYANIPTDIQLRGEMKAIEWCDAIHAATADSRGNGSFLATTDQRLWAVPHFRKRIAI